MPSPFFLSKLSARVRRHLGAGLPGASLIFGTLILGGCATGDYAFVTRISTGEKIQIPLFQGAPQHAKNGTIEIGYAGVLPGLPPSKKQFIYLFGFTESSGKAPRSVRIDDVSDDKAMLILEDKAPTLVDAKHWGAKSRAFEPDDPVLHWVNYVDDSMRVFRFTIVDWEGKTVVLNQGWYVPGWAKGGIRHLLGTEPPVKTKAPPSTAPQT